MDARTTSEARRLALEARLRSRRRRDRILLFGTLLGLALLIGLKVALDLRAGEEPAPAEHGARPGRVHIPGDEEQRAARLAREHAAFVLEGGELQWTDGAERRYRVTRVGSDGVLRVDTPQGGIEVAPEVWRARPEEGPPPALDTLVARARVDATALDGGVLLGDGFLPVRLQLGRSILLPEGELSPDREAPRTARAERARRQEVLREALATWLGGLREAPLDEGTRRATAEIVGRLVEDDGNSFTSLAPQITRRLVRHGWLRQAGVDLVRTAALEDAVRDAARPTVVERCSGPAGSWTRYRDGDGRKVTVLETAAATWYTVPQPDPQWLGDSPKRRLTIRVAAGTDPFGPDVKPLAAHLTPFDGRWTAGGPLEMDPGPWHRAVASTVGRDGFQPDNLFPAHILVTNGLGDALVLVTRHGEVRPAGGDDPAERQRFFDEAARALPDLAHMDLVGEILYTYAWDTAEYDRPLLLGTEAINGDIHQTAEQTLQTCCGGIYRGDCDDLACFFHALTRHQGRNAHVLSLPHHLANAYAREEADGSWRVEVLHTGPPLSIRGDTLEEALLATFTYFESHESVDLDGLPFSLRFGGDAVRQRYMLPYDIFRDAAYADGLIEVQSAYRFHTYRSGIEAMQALLATRARPTTADHREIAHLLAWAQRDAEATPHFERALAAARSPGSRVDAGLDLLANLVTTKQPERVTALVEQLTKQDIRILETTLGYNLVQPWLRVATALLADEAHRAQGLGILAGIARARVEPSLQAIELIAHRDGFDPRWLHYNGMPRHTTNVGRYASAALTALQETRTDTGPGVLEHRQVLDTVVRRWFDRVAFPTRHPNTSVLALYAMVAGYYEGTIGEANLGRLVDAAGAPTPEDLERAATPHGLSATPSRFYLRMIHGAPAYHRTRWWRGLVAEDEDFDASVVRRALFADLASRDAASRAGLGHLGDPNDALVARLGLTLLEGTPAKARPLLAEAAARRDPNLDAVLVRLLAVAAARHEPAAWLPFVEAWADETGRAPDFFHLAWSAMRAEHPAHAQAMARLAVARHPERADFAREREHLDRVAALQKAR